MSALEIVNDSALYKGSLNNNNNNNFDEIVHCRPIHIFFLFQLTVRACFYRGLVYKDTRTYRQTDRQTRIHTRI